MQRLVVKLTAGADDPEKCAQAFTVAVTALASGAEVSMWLTGEAAWFAVPGRAEAFELPHSVPLEDLRDTLLDSQVLVVCSQCAARRGLEQKDLLPGVAISGAAAFVEQALSDNTQALVY